MSPDDMIALVDTHGVAVYRFCLRLTGSRQEAEDLYQQAFLRALELADRIDHDRNPLGFLFSVTAGIHRRRRSKASRRQRILPQVQWRDDDDGIGIAAAPVDLEMDAEHRELSAAMRRLVQTLPDKLQIPVVMYYTGGMGVAEVAEAMGIRQGTVKSRLYQARKVLRAGLEATGYGQE